jgi:phosphoribosylformylglycinamidine synthase subunit PurSL
MPTMPTPIHRIEVRPRPQAGDPRGEAARRDAASLGLTAVPERIDTASVFLIEGDLAERELERIARELLADPVTEESIIGASRPKAAAIIEVHPLPGVMDPDAESIEQAVRAMLGKGVEVRTGRRYDFHGVDATIARQIVERSFANAVIHGIYDQPYHPSEFPHGHKYELNIVEVPIRNLDDAALQKLSRHGHLFLSLEEMRAIQEEYRALGREPREIELETLAQTWSEHCVHKTLKATIRYTEKIGREHSQSPGIAIPGLSRPGHELHNDGSITFHNLLKSTVAAATHELIEDGIDWCLSVFVDNAGIIAFDDEHAVCFKVETHNHPSAIEPYGGAATGIGGCIRDIIGTGLAAKPIAATDVFCVANPDQWNGNQSPGMAMPGLSREMQQLPSGCLHPRRILQQVVAGVRDYGNRMGIPTLNGAVWFDNDYVGNPLVYCGCIGVMPKDKVKGEPQSGDRIIALGGRTGRDGIHGATFSSAELTDTHADEFSHAVQIGNPVTEKKLLDAILEARDHEAGCLFSAITDCGAGGFSSAVGEMGEKLGAEVHLERAPLKYAGLSPTEIWISEAQERMVLAVPEGNIKALRAVCAKHDVELCDLGTFGTPGSELILNYHGVEVGRLPMEFLHDGLPQTVREAVFETSKRQNVETSKHSPHSPGLGRGDSPNLQTALESLLSHPNIASKHWIIQQYDHEVQGRTMVKPLTGPNDGPSDAAVITPVEGSTRGLAVACGLATLLRDDPYLMTIAAIDECVRNLVCVGADPNRIAILDNFCWPSCKDPHNLGSLVRAAEGCYDGAKAYRTPFISGKDSLNNQFTTDDGRTIQIPPTLLISGFGIVPDVRRAITMDAKAAGNALVLVGVTQPTLASSHYAALFGADGAMPTVDLQRGPQTAQLVAHAIVQGLVCSAHDLSDGGLLVAAAEMAFAGGLGATINLDAVPVDDDADEFTRAFGESPSRYLLEVEPGNLDALRAMLGDMPHAVIGAFDDSARFRVGVAVDAPIDELRRIWREPLDW